MNPKDIKNALQIHLECEFDKVTWKMGRINYDINFTKEDYGARFIVDFNFKVFKPHEIYPVEIIKGACDFQAKNHDPNVGNAKFCQTIANWILEYVISNTNEYSCFQNIRYFIKEKPYSKYYKEAVLSLVDFLVMKNIDDWEIFRTKEILRKIAEGKMHSTYLSDLNFKYSFFDYSPQFDPFSKNHANFLDATDLLFDPE